MSDTPQAAPKKQQILREKIMHRVDLTDKEMREYGAEVGRVNAEYLRLEDELASVKSDYKGRLDAKDAKRNALSTKLANGYEMREVEAIVEFDAAAGRKKYIHPVTKECIRDTEMTHADWQLPMFSKAEMEKIRKPLPEEPKAEPQLSDADKEIVEAAAAQTKVELDLEQVIEEGGNVSTLISRFKAATAEWPKNISAGIAKLAKGLEDQGTGAVIEFLRPFTVTK